MALAVELDGFDFLQIGNSPYRAKTSTDKKQG